MVRIDGGAAVAPLIEVRGLTYKYANGAMALRGVGFDLHASECVVLLGPNGSGKTTFVLHLNGILQTPGRVSVCGLDPAFSRDVAQVRRRVGFVFQNSDDQLFMPAIAEDVAFGPLNMGMPEAEARRVAAEALLRVGLRDGHDRAPWNLSAGEKRRVAIAGVLAMQPDVLVLDEPTTFLDPPGRRELAETLRSLPQAKVVVTHDVPFARAVGTRAVFFDAGRIVAEGSVDELVRRFEWDV